MRFKTMAFAAMVSVAMPVIAQTDNGATPNPDPKPKKERKICRALPARTGSNMTPSVCHTKTEWAMIDNNGVDPMANGSGRSSTDTGNLGPGVH